MIEPKIALCLICKGDNEEAKLLDRCLENVSPFVDGIFITSTFKKGEQPNKMVEKITLKYGGFLSVFQWCNNFSKARNFNFQQVPKQFDYILWCDTDDVYRGLEKLKPTIMQNPQSDAFAFWYLYEFDKDKQPVVVHKKTMVVRNDGCADWKGALHEDLIPNRSIRTEFIEGIDRMHFTDERRIDIARKRNVEVAQEDLEANPNDPRAYFNLANSCIGDAQYQKAKDNLVKFIELTGSQEERYLSQCRLAMIEDSLGNRDKAIEEYQKAIGQQPNYSDAYLQLGQLLLSYGRLDEAENYLLFGMIKKPPVQNVIVFNPRDYDYAPMNALAKVYYQKSRPDLALPMLEGCSKIYPGNKLLKELVKEMKHESKRLLKVVKVAERLEKVVDKEKLARELAKIPVDLRSHPAISSIKNKNFFKTKSTGRDITYYCGMTTHSWNPEMAKTKGIGGSEEAVINLSREWVKQGYNVTVYNNCGTEEMKDNIEWLDNGNKKQGFVQYKPFWEYNLKDKTDYTIIWRFPKLLDYDIGGKVYVDLHDVVSAGEFNEKRIQRVDKIFVKTKFHRSLFPNVPDEKIAIIPNGQDFELFNQDIKKDQMLLVNTSSPDRSMDVLPELFKRVKERVPEAKCKWAYGWEIFDNNYKSDKAMMAWKKEILDKMEDAGIENLGRLSQKDCAKLYLEGNILAYPSEFAEIDCITVKKAQACGCIPVTTNFGALDESVQYGVKVPSNKTKDNWNPIGKVAFGLEDEKSKQLWVDAVVGLLQTPTDNREFMKEWSHKFSWDKISQEWINIWQ